jgi:hypothetical protein
VPALISTAGASDANSYVSDAEFLDYLLGRPNAPDVSEGERAEALIMATVRIDVEEYRGQRANGGVDTYASQPQALKWPRWGVVADGFNYRNDAIPDPVKRATMELAIHILREGARDFFADPEADLQGLERFESVKVDVLTIKPRLRESGGSKLPRIVWNLLRPVLSSGPGQIRLQRA